jgi:hypothetical protein
MVVLAIAFIILIISAFFTLDNQNENKSKYPNAMDFFGIFYLFFSGELLNAKGKKWRPVFIFSLLILVIMAIGSNSFDIC